MRMRDTVRRVAWFFCAASLCAYAIFLFAGSFFHAREFNAPRTVQVRDTLVADVHDLSGMVMVPRTCDQLMVRTSEISPTTHTLTFTTWQLPAVECREEEVPRSFRVGIASPAEQLTLLATLDSRPLTVVVEQTIAE